MSPTFLLLHGLPGHGDQWGRHRELLAPHRVIAPTFAGFEPGGPLRAFPSTAEHAAQIVGWGAGLDPRGLVVVAWSFACHPLLYALAELGFAPARTMLYDPSGDSYLDAEAQARHRAAAGSAFGPVFAALGEPDDMRLTHALFAATGDEDTLAGLSWREQALFVAGAPTLRQAFTGSGPSPISAAALGALRPQAMTVATGARSKELFRISAQAVARLVPGANLREVPAADHMWPITHPQEFCSLLSEIARPD